MLTSRTVVASGGRIVVPAKIRKALDLHIGDEVLLTVEGEELHVSTLKSAIKEAQTLMRKYNPKKTSLSQALINQRREEARDE